MPATLPAPATPQNSPKTEPAATAIPDAVFAGPVPPKRAMTSFFAGKPAEPAKPEAPPVKEPPAKAPEPPVEVKEPAKAEPEKPADDLLSELTKAAPAKTEETAPAAPAPTGGQLRQKLEETIAENKKIKARLEELENTDVKEVETVKERAKQLEERLRIVSYRDSEEYKAKYEKPIETAIAKATKVAARLKLETGEGLGKAQHVAELHSLLSREDDAKAVERATELFGDSGQRVLDAVQDIVDAEQAAGQALESWKTESADRLNREQLEMRKTVEGRLKQFKQHVSDFQEQRPELFEFEGPQVEAFNKYQALADTAFTGDGRKPEELIPVQALVRNMAAAFVPTRLQLQAAKARIAELEAHVQQLSGAAPSVNPTTGQPASAKPSTSLDALRSALRAT